MKKPLSHNRFQILCSLLNSKENQLTTTESIQKSKESQSIAKNPPS